MWVSVVSCFVLSETKCSVCRRSVSKLLYGGTYCVKGLLKAYLGSKQEVCLWVMRLCGPLVNRWMDERWGVKQETGGCFLFFFPFLLPQTWCKVKIHQFFIKLIAAPTIVPSRKPAFVIKCNHHSMLVSFEHDCHLSQIPKSGWLCRIITYV